MEKLTGFSTLDLVMKNRGKDVKFEKVDMTEGHVLIDGYLISERTSLTNGWNSVLIKGNDTRICRRYLAPSIPNSVNEDLTQYVSPEILTTLQLLNILK